MPDINHQILADALPYLRRYSRALTGNSKTADTLVLATIQALSQTNSMAADVFRKIDLYRIFTQILNGPAGDHVKTLSPLVEAESNVERRILGIPSMARQAFLLGAVEGFNDRQIVEILDIVPLRLPALKAEATAQIIKQVATDALIIEDEMFIAADLEDILTSLGHNVIGIERTHAAAVRAIKFARPSLILADIQLADGSCGIDAVNEILL